MEYLLISLIIIPIFMLYKIINKSKKIKVRKVIFTSQSRTIEMMNQLYDNEQEALKKYSNKQSIKFFNKVHPRILILDNHGYWIQNNAVYRAEFTGNGIDHNTTVQLDTMTMDDVELKKLIFIIEQLTEGLNNEDSSKWH